MEGWVHKKERDKQILFTTYPLEDGAEGETRTPTGEPPLDPEPSASTNSATSATKSVDLIFKMP